MAGEKKKIDLLDEKISRLQGEYEARQSQAPTMTVEPFSYDAESDKGYQEYVRLMQEQGKRAMEDTVGKASALTGGYGNSYAAVAGQQVYNDYAKQAADGRATYEQLAREGYQMELAAKELERANFDAQNQDILNQLNMLKEQKRDVWDEAALRAGFGDYSGYVDDLGLYASKEEAGAAFTGNAAPTEAQIAYAKEAYKKGEVALDGYVQSLVGVDTDALYEAVRSDTALMKDKAYVENWFKEGGDDGGFNGGGGLDNDATLRLGEETKTVKAWLKELTKPTDEGGKYGFTEKEAKDILLRVQSRLGI